MDLDSSIQSYSTANETIEASIKDTLELDAKAGEDMPPEMVGWLTGFPFIMPTMQHWAADLVAKTTGRTSRSLAARGAPSLSPATLPPQARPPSSPT